MRSALSNETLSLMLTFILYLMTVLESQLKLHATPLPTWIYLLKITD